jgi:hypothetical protein
VQVKGAACIEEAVFTSENEEEEKKKKNG